MSLIGFQSLSAAAGTQKLLVCGGMNNLFVFSDDLSLHHGYGGSAARSLCWLRNKRLHRRTCLNPPRLPVCRLLCRLRFRDAQILSGAFLSLWGSYAFPPGHLLQEAQPGHRLAWWGWFQGGPATKVLIPTMQLSSVWGRGRFPVSVCDQLKATHDCNHP